MPTLEVNFDVDIVLINIHLYLKIFFAIHSNVRLTLERLYLIVLLFERTSSAFKLYFFYLKNQIS